ncbi:MAG: Sec-independent protein translocase protein TatB [Paracoccus sp. (in: a-proteobacteria)]|uniref:Sec-independent protein translocase protein TatB n=1 Tax=Paracoccus sp. TaxID=267 RepID=UPI00391D6D84
MLDIGWTELLLIGVVALIVVGPKDLPHLFHSLGRITAKARGMAREFSSAMEDAAKGAGLDEAKGTLRDMKNLTSKKSLGLDALDRATERFEKWDPKRPATRTTARDDKAILDPAAPVAAEPAQTPAAPAGEDAAETATVPAALPAAGPSPSPSRRLHAVRRSDMKDD